MSEQDGPGRPEERGGQEAAGGGSARGGDGRAEAAEPGDTGEAAEAGEATTPRHARLFIAARIALAIFGPAVLTTAYFTLPFDPIGPAHRVLSWLILVGLLAVLAFGMVVTTTRAMMNKPGYHPALGILLLSWTAILVFAAGYWALATRPGEFVGLQTRLDALYFTGVTMATVGYGDIHPTGQLARAIVLVQLVYTFSFLVSGVTALRTKARTRLERRGGG